MSYLDTAEKFTDDVIRRYAERQDVDIIWSDDKTLLLDIDEGQLGLNAFWRQWDMLLDTHPDATMFSEPRVLPSRHGSNHHVIIKTTAPLSLSERITLQAVLGSDIKRELLSLVGMLWGQGNPTVLFRPKGETL